MSEHPLMEKIQKLPSERVAEVEDFVDFLLEREAGITREASHLSQRAFESVWDNPEDGAYDAL